MNYSAAGLSGQDIAGIIKAAIAVGGALVVFFVLYRAATEKKRNAEKAKKLREKNSIDNIRTDMLKASDMKAFFENSAKPGYKGMLMTGAALKAKDNDISIPAAPRGRQVYYMSVITPDGKTAASRFVTCGCIDQSLEALLEEHSGCVVFEI